MKKIYLDYNATTPIHPEVAEFARLFCMSCSGTLEHALGRQRGASLHEQGGSV